MGDSSRPNLPTGTVTFLFSDIEGSTRLIQERGAAAQELIARHHELLRTAFDAAGGVEVRTEGDSFFVTFHSAPDAVGAATAGQRALDAEPWPDGAAIRVRIGLHSGFGALEPAARRIFGRLSVFSGGWDLDAADSVCGPGAETGLAVLDGIAQLVDGSLVRALTTGPTSRFAMLETIRDFAADRLEEAGDAPEIRRRHAMHYLTLAESAAVHLPGRNQLSWLARLTEERDNVRAAIQVVIDTSDTEAGLRFAAALWRYWQFDGHIAEGRATIDAVLALPGAERPSHTRMRALEAAGGLLFYSRESDGAKAMYEAQLALARELADRAGEADALFNLAHMQSDIVAGAETFEAAGRLYRQLGDRRGEARVDAARGVMIMFKGDALAARDILRIAANRLHELDDVFFEALVIVNLSGIALSLGDLHESLLNWRRAMELSRELGDLASTTVGLQFMAIVAAEHGRPEAAVRINVAFEALCRTYAVRPPARLEVLLSKPNYAAHLFETLGQERFEGATEQGRRMSLDEAVEDALAVSLDIEAHVS